MHQAVKSSLLPQHAVAKPDQYSPHIIGTADNEIWWMGNGM